MHGDTRVDDYAWMSDRRDRRLAAYLRAENAYARKRTAHLDPLVETIVAEITSRTVETDLAVPVHHGGWWYYTRTEAGQEYPVHARVAVEGPLGEHPQRPQLADGRPPPGEQVLLDENVEAGAGDYFELGALELSPDDTRIVVGADRRGEEIFDLVVRDVRTGATLDDSIRGVGEAVAWSRDGRQLFYTRLDGSFRPHEVWRHVIGADPSTDVRVLAEPDERFFCSVGASKDDRWLVFAAHSKTTSQVWLLDADTPELAPTSVAPRQAGVLYEIELCGAGILLWHNETRPNFEICWVPAAGAGRDTWVALDWTTEHELVGDVDAYPGFVALALRGEGRTVVRIVPVLDAARPVDGPACFGMPRDVHPPGPHGAGQPGGTIGLGATPDPDSPTVQIVHESFAGPPSVWDLHVATGEWELLRRRPVPGYDLSVLREQRIWATAPDGTGVPISLVHHERVTPDGTAAAVLHGYGAYGIPLDPVFSVSLLSLLDRGVVFAVAHVRGGTELGWGWYEQGRLEHKEHSITDFLACADALVEQGWCAPDRLAAQGASAGGLLVGAALNRAPGRFRVVHAQVPFVDMLTTMLDPSLPLTVTEREEWGDPIADPAAYARLRGYAPYDNVGTGPHPALLVSASVHDTRVHVTEPAKWVARLRDRVTDDPQRPILFRTELAAGHGGRSGRYQVWREVAWEWAVLVDLLGGDAHVDGGGERGIQ